MRSDSAGRYGAVVNGPSAITPPSTSTSVSGRFPTVRAPAPFPGRWAWSGHQECRSPRARSPSSTAASVVTVPGSVGRVQRTHGPQVADLHELGCGDPGNDAFADRLAQSVGAGWSAGPARRAGLWPLGRRRHHRGRGPDHGDAGDRDAGPYQLRAAIAAVHDEAARAEDTDWRQILGLYELLAALASGPMVTLNRIVAVAMVRGPAVALEQLDTAPDDPALDGHHRVDAVRAHLLEQAGQPDAAREHYRRAAQRTLSVPEKRYLLHGATRR